MTTLSKALSGAHHQSQALWQTLCFAVFAFTFLTQPTWAAEGARVALVVGISNYQNTAPLANPVRDASGVATALRAAGFDVMLKLDITQQDFGNALLEFEEKVKGADAALFYFAGHGIQVDSGNYLLSRGAAVENPHLIDTDGILLDSVIEIMEANADVSIAFVDACRDNPLANSLRKKVGDAGRSLGLTRGLAPLKQDYSNSLVAFATAPGAVALDGTTGNSPFTQALLEHLNAPDVEVSVMLKRVTRDVIDATEGSQRPEVVASMAREFYFVKNEVTVQGDVILDTKSGDEEVAARLLEAAQTMPSGMPRINALRLVRDRFPETAAAGLATILMKEIIDTTDLTEDDIAAGAFDGTQLSSLDVDKAISEARQNLPETASPEEIEQALALAREDTQRIQVALNAMGYDLGTADGTFGPRSREALRQFQLASRVAQSGYLNRETINAILKTFDEAPKTYHGQWRLDIYRKWLKQDKGYAGNYPGREEHLASLVLSFDNGVLQIADYTIMTVQPEQPFRDFKASLTDDGSLQVSGLVSTHFPDAENKVAKEQAMRMTEQLPRIVPRRLSLGLEGNVFEPELRFTGKLTRVSGSAR